MTEGNPNPRVRRQRRPVRIGGPVAIVLVLLLGLFWEATGADSNVQESEAALARTTAVSFLSETATLPLARIDGLTLTWRVHMKVRLGIRMQMTASLDLRREDDEFVSTFRLTAPQGKDPWSWLLLNLFGRHTQEYRELVRRIEVRLDERFSLQEGRLFRTRSLEDFLPEEKKYAEQTAIRLLFPDDAGPIRFWPDKSQPSDVQSMAWNGQMGPMTAFFNYVFFFPPQSDLRIVNALKEVVDAPDGSDAKTVTYLFSTEKASLGPNRTGRHRGYAMAITLEKGNFLDILYGEQVFFQLEKAAAGLLKIPHRFRIEGIISKNQKMKRLQVLREGNPNRAVRDDELYADLDEILAARDVRGFLIDYAVSVSEKR